MPHKPADSYEKIISRIVEGQIKSFLHAHPEVAEGWAGKRSPGKTKAMAVTDSLAKRITRELISPQVRAQIYSSGSGLPGNLPPDVSTGSLAPEVLTGADESLQTGNGD
jgi:hypothetical protein